MVDQTTIPPGPPKTGCHFCDGTGIVNETSYALAVRDGLERMAWKPGTRCPCTCTWEEILPAVENIFAEIVERTADE